MPSPTKAPRLPPLNALRAFEAAARHLNFRVAAEEIGVTQGAVAQRVRNLEDVLGLQLFDRLPRGLALTTHGSIYFSSVQRALTIIANATEALAHRASSLTVSTTPSFASKWLIPRLATFTDAYPSIEVRVIADQQLSTFKRDGVDIAIRHGKPPFGKGLAADPLFPVDIYAVCSPSLADSKRPLRKPSDLKHHVLLHDSHDLWPEFLEALNEGGHVDPSKGPRFSQSALAIDAAISGQGIALTSEQLVERDLAAGRLCRLFDFALHLSLSYYVVYPEDRRDSETIRAMRDWLITQARYELKPATAKRTRPDSRKTTAKLDK
ncbi:transcriptional regulator GcvA [Paraburkholderia aromaticivorans]|uniref:transcriptional regulator GcvA n=1 Tax=Paraburkholderia aromaticivorans TaxID=2026199 RepID=UPI001455E19F|nr:transcriptional regulator GcvA [Paraburkholderia aromaticivorans]